MADPVYDFWLRDNNYNLVERIDEWVNMTIIMRFNKVGSFTFEVPLSSNVAKYMTPTSGIIVPRDRVTIFSGSITTEWRMTSTSIIASGTDDNFLLESTARPTPALAQAPYDTEFDVVTAIASSVMISLVARNIGSAAPVEWKIPQLIFKPDTFVGSVITSRARFDPLITILAELASTPIATGLGFKILQSDDSSDTLLFQIYVPRDKHLETIFDMNLHTAVDYEWVHQAPQANYFQVAGGDDFGTDRTIIEGGDDTNIAAVGRRIPAFIDKRGTTDTGELEQALAEQLATVVTVDAITITAADVPSLQFGRDYDLGDYVTAVVQGHPYPRLIQEIEIDFDPQTGPVIKPLIGDPGATNDESLVQHLNTLENRLSNLEVNWNVPDDSITEDMLHPFMKTLPGDIKITAFFGAQTGYLLCDGSAVSRSVYNRLFARIGTNYGIGDGSTTFNIPDLRNRLPMGAGSVFAPGTSGGSITFNLSHFHHHSHGMNNHFHAGAAHTHPGSHSHGDDHLHGVDINHDHPNASTSPANADTGGSFASLGSGSFDHHHDFNMPALGTTGKSTLSQTVTDTDPDSNAPGASYSSNSGPASPSSTESDDVVAGNAAYNIIPPYQVFYYEVYTGHA